MSDAAEQKGPPAPASTSASGIELAPGVFAPASAVRVQYSRSGGPGGQNVNKVNTKAEVWVPLAAIAGLSHRALGRYVIRGARRANVVPNGCNLGHYRQAADGRG